MKKRVKNTQVGERLQESLYEIKDILADTKDDMQERASVLVDEVLSNLKKQTQSKAEDLESYIQDRPFKALTAVALAGFLIGKFVL